MESLAILLGHLVGDFILQNDWQAQNKTNHYPGPEPYPNKIWLSTREVIDDPELDEQRKWWKVKEKYIIGHYACTIHCLLYTLSMWVFTWQWIHWWGLVLCFAIHWPIDRFRLARFYMERISGQYKFANEVFSPWSIVVVDNIFHLLTIYGIWLIS